MTPTATLIAWIEAAIVVLNDETALPDAKTGAAICFEHNINQLDRRVVMNGDREAAAFIEKLSNEYNAAEGDFDGVFADEQFDDSELSQAARKMWA